MKRYFGEQKKLFFVGFSFYIIAFLFKTSSYFAQMETMGSAIAQDLPRLLFFVALQYGALILFRVLHMTHEFFMQKAFNCFCSRHSIYPLVAGCPVRCHQQFGGTVKQIVPEQTGTMQPCHFKSAGSIHQFHKRSAQRPQNSESFWNITPVFPRFGTGE